MAPQRMQGKPHRHRDDLIGEHPLADAGQVTLAVLFFAVWVLDTFVLRYTTWLNDYVPLAVRIPLGIALLAVAAYLARTGLSVVFGEETEKPVVHREGVFGVVRHPVYLSELVLYLGFLVMSSSLAAALVWGSAIIFFYHICRFEERLLLAHFADEYAQYMRDVPMWIPRLWRRR